MSPRIRRAPRAAFALLALLLATPTARAHAQPACAAGTVADYTAPGFACRIGSWVFGGIGFANDLTATGGATGAVADAGTITLTPFFGHDAVGRTTFGFDFGGFAASVDAVGSTSTEVFGDAFVGLGLHLTSLDSHVGLGGARLLGTQSVAGAPRAGDAFGTVESELSGVVAAVEPSPTSEFCLFALERARTPGDGAVDRAGTCNEAPAPRWLGVSVSASAQVAGHLPATPLSASVRASVTRLEFTAVDVAAVPEPATVALLGGGLLLLAPAATRRVSARRR